MEGIRMQLLGIALLLLDIIVCLAFRMLFIGQVLIPGLAIAGIIIVIMGFRGDKF